ncbi:SDR family NAD(P)-dependent oxidoreductase [Micromonospora sp. WMMD1102]|uniref:SDR family oxidoreductase n=1 Tax=Micromonospora sp. WMMD1102 TaxID=3016105 RepID=UPI00241539F9|nr:SDR family oxidoreductase [Micromonospora sp. WMMD1102]MDG4788659.1 SDR family NAD(P)-dependent oxidoreductase [Micromonospora sp. WMMD1102]
MLPNGPRVVVTGAGRGTGRTLALAFAERGAHVVVSARDPAAAGRTADLIRLGGAGTAEAHGCDLADPASVRGFAAALADRNDRIDVLVNNGAGYLPGVGLDDASDEEIVETVAGTATGTLLLTRHLLPLLRASDRPDVVNLVSACGEVGHHRSEAHPAYYAAKHAQAGFAGILSHRLRAEGVRVISLYPPDFVQDGPREPGAPLTARSVVECVLFAVGQPRDCFIREFHFEQVRSPGP